MKKTRPAWWIEGVNAPDTPMLWHEIDPWEEVRPDEPEEPYAELPMTLGPAPDGPAGPASGVDLGTGRMAAELHWKT